MARLGLHGNPVINSTRRLFDTSNGVQGKVERACKIRERDREETCRWLMVQIKVRPDEGGGRMEKGRKEVRKVTTIDSRPGLVHIHTYDVTLVRVRSHICGVE